MDLAAVTRDPLGVLGFFATLARTATAPTDSFRSKSVVDSNKAARSRRTRPENDLSCNQRVRVRGETPLADAAAVNVECDNSAPIAISFLRLNFLPVLESLIWPFSNDFNLPVTQNVRLTELVFAARCGHFQTFWDRHRVFVL
jgi:hypothetical protein